MKNTLLWFLTSFIAVIIGVAAGWFAVSQNQSANVAPAHGHASGSDADKADANEASDELSEQTLKNLGVTLGVAELSDFTRTARVQATVKNAPLNFHHITAPIGGLVTKIHVAPGDLVSSGDAIVSLARAPIPRPELTLTADILTPISENLHDSASALRSAIAQHAIAREEYERLEAIVASTGNGLSVVPKQTLINRGYDLRRAAQEKENAEHKLRRHGLSNEEIKAVEQGEPAPRNQRLLQRALRQHGLWGETEQNILAALDSATQTRPWTIAAIGELSAAGLATKDLSRAFAASTPMRKQFVAVAALLLDGHTIAHARILADAGALEPVYTLRAPKSAPDWDVAELVVRVGHRVEAGAEIAQVYNGRSMWLRLEPVGDEAGLVLAAFESGAKLTAKPLPANAGPALDDLSIHQLTTARERNEPGLAFIVAQNLAVIRGGKRSWRLRSDQRYLVHVPLATLNQRFVLPASAVTDRGPDRVVYLPDGKTFRAVPVTVEFADETTTVVANDGAIFPGDRIVKTGAFSLGLAMQAGAGAADAHAGHDH